MLTQRATIITKYNSVEQPCHILLFVINVINRFNDDLLIIKQQNTNQTNACILWNTLHKKKFYGNSLYIDNSSIGIIIFSYYQEINPSVIGYIQVGQHDALYFLELPYFAIYYDVDCSIPWWRHDNEMLF